MLCSGLWWGGSGECGEQSMFSLVGGGVVLCLPRSFVALGLARPPRLPPPQITVPVNKTAGISGVEEQLWAVPPPPSLSEG